MKVALNSYSIRNEWNFIMRDKYDAIIDLCKDMDIDQVELLDRHFEKDQLKAICKKFSENGINVFAIGPHVHLLAKDENVDKEVSEGKEWLNLAKEAGVKMIRFQVGDGPLPRAFAPMDDFDDEEWEEYHEYIDEAIEQSKKVVTPLLAEAEKLDVVIGIETHHSYSSNYVYMKKFDEIYKSDNIGWIFDIGNYENDDMRWKALDVIKTNTVYIHAKGYDFDDKGFAKLRDGTELNYLKAANVLWDAGFRGNWSIEFEGSMNGLLGALKSNEIIKYSIAKAKGDDYEIKTEFPDVDELMEKYFA